jgi:hypothetical protein
MAGKKSKELLLAEITFAAGLVKEVGGFRTHAVGEDLDLVIRLHRHPQEDGRPYHINFIPDPTCWTEAPSDPCFAGPTARTLAQRFD